MESPLQGNSLTCKSFLFFFFIILCQNLNNMFFCILSYYKSESPSLHPYPFNWLGILANWRKATLSERQKKHITNFHNFTCYTINMLPLEINSFYTETDDVLAISSFNKNHRRSKVWFLSPGGDFVTIQGLTFLFL